MNKYEISDLRQRQSLPLNLKVQMSERRIREWYEYWNGNVYISFSGGKDSVVLLDIVRKIYPEVPAVYCDTGLEFPEIKEFVKTFDNVRIIRPKISFKEVIDKFGWVFPNKETAKLIEAYKRGVNYALKAMLGLDINGNYSKYKQRYKKWLFLTDCDFNISDRCCNELKKKPFASFVRETGLQCINACTADESMRRTSNWLQYGCNIYSKNHVSVSRPLSVWLETDILKYIVDNELKICSVYGDIKIKNGIYYTTGEKRTGCIFCPVGCHLEKGDNRRFVRLKRTHPQLYSYCLNVLGLKEFLDFISLKLRLKESLY